MKGYVIDPFIREVKEVETDGTIQDLYRLLGCSVVEMHYIEGGNGDVLWLDEEGKINGKPQKFFFCHAWPYDILAGRALWLGSKGEANRDAQMPVNYVRDVIEWQEPDEDGRFFIVPR